MILQPRYEKNKMATQRRRRLVYWQKFNGYHAFKARIKYGRRNPTYWWREQ